MSRVLILAMGLLLAPISASAQLAPADAGDFMGVWTLALETPQGSFEQTMTVKDEGGKVIAEITNQMVPDVQKVTDIAKKGTDFVMKYSGNFQGNPYEAVVTFTPDGADKAKVTFDINGGQFMMQGAGTRTKK